MAVNSIQRYLAKTMRDCHIHVHFWDNSVWHPKSSARMFARVEVESDCTFFLQVPFVRLFTLDNTIHVCERRITIPPHRPPQTAQLYQSVWYEGLCYTMETANLIDLYSIAWNQNVVNVRQVGVVRLWLPRLNWYSRQLNSIISFILLWQVGASSIGTASGLGIWGKRRIACETVSRNITHRFFSSWILASKQCHLFLKTFLLVVCFSRPQWRNTCGKIC